MKKLNIHTFKTVMHVGRHAEIKRYKKGTYMTIGMSVDIPAKKWAIGRLHDNESCT